MARIGDIILSREKTSVLPEDLKDSDEPYFMLCSNRTAFTLTEHPITDSVVVRGHNLPGTIRMTAAIVDRFHQDRAILRDGNPQMWGTIWTQMLSHYERQHLPDNWISVHVNGQPHFSTIADNRIDHLEREAQGGEITDNVVRTASAEIIGKAAQVMIEHDSQTALVISEAERYTRCAILRRGDGENGSFTVTAYRDEDGSEDVPGTLNLAANLIEATNHTLFLDQVRKLVSESNILENPSITPQRVRDALARQNELVQQIEVFGLSHRLLYTPEKPAFLETD